MFEVEYSDFDDLRKQFGNMRKWDMMHLGFEIVKGTFKFFDIKREIKKFGRKTLGFKGFDYYNVFWFYGRYYK